MLLLIGGGSCVGKTTAARALAAGLQLPHVELGVLLSAPEYDKVFNAQAPGFWDREPADILEELKAKGDAALAGLPRWLGQHSDERGIVLEGEGIHPSFMSDLGDLPGIRLVFIVEESAERMRETLLNRSSSYRGLSEAEQNTVVEVNLLYNQWIAAEAKTHGHPCLASQPWNSLPARLLRAL